MNEPIDLGLPDNKVVALKASEWVLEYAKNRGFSIYSKQIGAVLAFLDACGLEALMVVEKK